jgi:hypothetical protein
MNTLLHVAILLLGLVMFAGCGQQALPSQARIQVNVPDEPHPGTRIKVITPDVDSGREVFVQLFNSTKRVGMCNPSKIEDMNDAHQVMTVSYRADSDKDRSTFYILRNSTGEWITTGYGGIEIYDHPEGFPEYRYTRDALRKIKAWYEKHVPQSDRKR